MSLRQNDGHLQLRMRAAQLDLARQKETVPFIRSFIEFIARYHFNALFLYLEDRVRTRSYPYPSVDESYSPEEVREIVTHAAERGIDVIPVVPNLGHTERFLSFPELRGLAELREGIPGRFGSVQTMVCPSLDATYDFFRRYYAEIAEIFPSPFLHVGNDESWDLGYCSKCAATAREKGLSRLFTEHLRRTHRIVAGEVGKRMMMWDDMYEICPDSLEAVPRDIVLCCWQYHDTFDKPVSHFLNRRREDLFRRYDELGFQYLLCPADWSVSNVLSFSRYAAAYRPLGGLVTSWEHSRDFLLRSMPVMAFAGNLWHDGDLAREEEILTDTLRAIFGVEDPVFLSAMELIARRRRWPGPTWTESVLDGPPTQMDLERELETRLLRRVLRGFLPAVRSQARPIHEDVLAQLDHECVHHALRYLLPATVQQLVARPLPLAEDDPLARRLAACVEDAEALATVRAAQWKALRPGIAPDQASQGLSDLADRVRRFAADARDAARLPTGFIRVHGFLPDRYEVPLLNLSIRFRAPQSVLQIACGCVKPLMDEDAYYQYLVPFRHPGVPDRLSLEVSGYGGMGFRYVEVVCAAGAFVPEEVARVSGIVEDASHLLSDDDRWTYVGDKDTARTFFTPGHASVTHNVEVTLRKV